MSGQRFYRLVFMGDCIYICLAILPGRKKLAVITRVTLLPRWLKGRISIVFIFVVTLPTIVFGHPPLFFGNRITLNPRLCSSNALWPLCALFLSQATGHSGFDRFRAFIRLPTLFFLEQSLVNLNIL